MRDFLEVRYFDILILSEKLNFISRYRSEEGEEGKLVLSSSVISIENMLRYIQKIQAGPSFCL